MSSHVATTAPAALKVLALHLVALGRLIEVTTASGAHYWVTPIAGREVRGSKVTGLHITTDSQTMEHFSRSPLQVCADNMITVGEPWHLGQHGAESNTSRVVSIRDVSGA